VSGELDMNTVPLLLSRTAEAGRLHPAVVLLDLSGLTFADVAGLRAFQTAASSLGLNGTQLVLADPQPRIRRLLAMIGLDRKLEVRGA
jgi:anti-anti-sigma factor